MLFGWLAGLVVSTASATAAPADVNEPPLAPVLERVEASLEKFNREVRDYTCRIVRRERIKGKVRPLEFANAKVRRAGPGGQPFSVYLRFLSPKSVAGREVLYVEGRNANKMLVRRGGQRRAYLTTYLDPESPLALEGSRHPITEAGFGRLLASLVNDLKEDLNEPGVQVTFYDNSKINDRPCTRIVIVHPEPKPHLESHRTDLFLDQELELPVSVATYLWPEEAGGKPRLIEQYVYDRIKLNVGLTDQDFDRNNPDYGFLKRSADTQ